MKAPERFLATHWQKRPLFMASARDFTGPQISADEAAWLAMQDDVESRLVFTERHDGKVSYRLAHGPFGEAELSKLPAEDWTLLVQDVDKHLPDFREWFTAIDFIPDWRIDDLMVSVAAPGGGVGPHLDNYDVFLVQASGERDWRIGDPATAAPDTHSEGLSLLESFAPVERRTVAPGDVLYLPPGVPHWGVAVDLCTTYSIGMRAPTRAELRAGADRVLGAEPGGDVPDEAFYEDDDLIAHEAEPGEINARALQRVANQRLLDGISAPVDLARVLGCVATDPKAWLMPEPIPPNATPDRIHGMARLAWASVAGADLVFANGAERHVSREQLAVFRRWRDSRVVTATDLSSIQATPDADELTEWLRLQGTFDANHGAE